MKKIVASQASPAMNRGGVTGTPLNSDHNAPVEVPMVIPPKVEFPSGDEVYRAYPPEMPRYDISEPESWRKFRQPPVLSLEAAAAAVAAAREAREAELRRSRFRLTRGLDGHDWAKIISSLTVCGALARVLIEIIPLLASVAR